ncbi:hypothetical protein [Sphingomonas sp. MMS24-J13]|uniref:hypothetical protein n=1 Tax=Sphingomonas sp. MMS24-J13 TaxID=3238686 RepID=UPI00384FD9A5
MGAAVRIERVLERLATELPGTTRRELSALLTLASERYPVPVGALPTLLAMAPEEIERFIALEVGFHADCGPMIELILQERETCVRLTQFACNIVNRAWAATMQSDPSSDPATR